jgi:BirA family transcriptional regulator, biotin operon repressor / biotin---[acetyl-CoA-carboxylase] ligase
VAIVDPIDEARLRKALLRENAPWADVRVVDEAGSTNFDLVMQARNGAPSGSVLIANFQSAGRGRQGRTWSAPPGTGVALSVLLHPVDVEPVRWGWLPLLAGLGVAEGLQRYPGVPVSLKWPNDVLIGDGKVAGILAERIDSPRGPAVVIGIGINVHSEAGDLPVPSATSLALHASDAALGGPLSRTALGGSLSRTALGGSLSRTALGGSLSRTEVVRSCLTALGERYLSWQRGETDEELANSYRSRSATIGRRVRVELVGGGPMEGVATGVDSGGRLVVRTDSRVQIVGAGDVIHLRSV